VRLDIALFAISGYLLMSISVYIRTYITGVFQISYGKFGPTEVRVAVIIANTLIYFSDNPAMHTGYGRFTLFDAIAFSIGIVLLAIFLFTTLRIALQLGRQEPPQPGV
jgi:archaetidylinositol phosphate synthase